MQRVVQKIAEFMRALLDEVRTRHAEQRREHIDMSRTVTSIIAMLAAQGAQIDQLVAQRNEAELADLDAIGAAIETNTAKMTAALTPSSGAQAPEGDSGAPITAVVTAPTTAGSTVVPVAQASIGGVATAVDAASTAGGHVTVAGPGIARGTTVVAADPASSTITLSAGTEAAHAGDGTEQLTVTPAPVVALAAA